MRRASSGVCVALIFCLLLLFYQAAYWLMLQHDARATVIYPDGTMYSHPVESYRFGRPVAGWLFWPVNQLDRRLRPEHWEPDAWH